jgi:hypothetical protein
MRPSEKLRAYWSKKEGLMLYSPMGFGTTSDARYVACVLSDEVLAELDERGYDTTTIKFSIEPKQGHAAFADRRPENMTHDEALEFMLKPDVAPDNNQCPTDYFIMDGVTCRIKKGKEYWYLFFGDEQLNTAYHYDHRPTKAEVKAAVNKFNVWWLENHG